MENDENLTTAKNVSPFQRKMPLLKIQEDKELLKTLFDQTAIFDLDEKYSSLNFLVKNEKKPQKTIEKKSSESQNQKGLSRSDFENSQREFMHRMQTFLDKKKKNVEEKTLQEKKSHIPVLTYKGYMSKSKSINELAYGESQRKNEFFEKIKQENLLKEMSQVKPQPQINENYKISSKLGLTLTTKDYIKNLEKKNLIKEENAQKLKKMKLAEDLQECSHKPEIKDLDRKILNKKIMDKKLNEYNFSNSYLRKNIKNKENMPINKVDLQEKIKDMKLTDQKLDMKGKKTEKSPTIFEQDLQKIKEEIRFLLTFK